MKPQSWVGLVFGFVLGIIGVLGLIFFDRLAGLIPLMVGIGLVYLNWRVVEPD